MKATLVRVNLVSKVFVDEKRGRIVGADLVMNRRLPAVLRPDFEAGRISHIPDAPVLAVTYVLAGGDHGEHELRANVVSPTGAYPDEAVRDAITWPQGMDEIEGVLRLGKLIITGIGTYEVRLAYDGEPLAVLPLDIKWDDE